MTLQRVKVKKSGELGPRMIFYIGDWPSMENVSKGRTPSKDALAWYWRDAKIVCARSDKLQRPIGAHMSGRVSLKRTDDGKMTGATRMLMKLCLTWTSKKPIPRLKYTHSGPKTISIW